MADPADLNADDVATSWCLISPFLIANRISCLSCPESQRRASSELGEKREEASGIKSNKIHRGETASLTVYYHPGLDDYHTTSARSPPSPPETARAPPLSLPHSLHRTGKLSLPRLRSLARQFSTTTTRMSHNVDPSCIFCKIIKGASTLCSLLAAGGGEADGGQDAGDIPSFKLIETDKT